MFRYLDNAQLELLGKTLNRCFEEANVIKKDENSVRIEIDTSEQLVELFISVKTIEGCSIRTYAGIAVSNLLDSNCLAVVNMDTAFDLIISTLASKCYLLLPATIVLYNTGYRDEKEKQWQPLMYFNRINE